MSESYIARQRRERSEFEARKKASGRTREEQRAVDNSNSPEAVQERRNAATQERADRLTQKGSSQAAIDATGVNDRVTITQPSRDSQGRTATDRAQAINEQRSSAEAVVLQSLAESRQRVEQARQPVLNPDRFGGQTIRSAEAVALQKAQQQQAQRLGPIGRAFVATNLARKATPEEVVAGRGVDPGRALTLVVATGALSDASTPLTSLRAASRTIAPSSYRGVTTVNKAAQDGRVFTLRSFDGVVSDSKGLFTRAQVKEIKVESSGLVFREETVGKKVARSVFTERDLFVVEKSTGQGRVVRAGVREETDIGKNLIRRVQIDETVIPNTNRARVGGYSSLSEQQRITSSLGASRRGSVLARASVPDVPDLSGVRFVGRSQGFVRAPVAPEVVQPLRFAKPTAAGSNRITGVIRSQPSVLAQPELEVRTGVSSPITFDDREVRPQSPTVLRPVVSPVADTQNRFRLSSRTPTTPARQSTPAARTPQAPTQIPTFKPVTQNPLRQRAPTVPKPTSTGRGPLTFKVAEPPVRFTLPKFDLPDRGNFKPQGFRAFVKVGGEFRPVGPVLSRREALEFGARTVSQTPSASFKIQSAGRAVETTLGLKGFFRGFGRSKKDEDVFVEPSKLRINTPGELRGITFKGIQSSRFKKVF